MEFHDVVRMNETAERCFKRHGHPIPILPRRKEGIEVVEAKCEGIDVVKPAQDRSSSLAVKKLDVVEAPNIARYGWVSIHKSPEPGCQWVLEGSFTEIKLDGGKYVLLTNRAKVSAGEGATLQRLHIIVFGQFFHNQLDNIERYIGVRLMMIIMQHMRFR